MREDEVERTTENERRKKSLFEYIVLSIFNMFQWEPDGCYYWTKPIVSGVIKHCISN